MTDYEKWLKEAWRLAKAEILIKNTLKLEGRTAKTFADALRMLEVAVKALRIEFIADGMPLAHKTALDQINEIAKEKE